MRMITNSVIDKDLEHLEEIRIGAMMLHVSVNDTNWMIEKLYQYIREYKKCKTKTSNGNPNPGT